MKALTSLSADPSSESGKPGSELWMPPLVPVWRCLGGLAGAGAHKLAIGLLRHVRGRVVLMVVNLCHVGCECGRAAREERCDDNEVDGAHDGFLNSFEVEPVCFVPVQIAACGQTAWCLLLQIKAAMS